MSLMQEGVELETLSDWETNPVRFARQTMTWPTFGPLRLTPFEWYMFDGGAQDTSMTFKIRLVFSGSVDRDAWTGAVCHAVRRHPLLRAQIIGSSVKKLAWIPASHPVPYLDYGDLDKPVRYPVEEKIDLRRETGLRIWVRSDDERTEMHFQFHHACCDGIGAYRVLEDMLCAYDLNINGDTSEAGLRPLESARLEDRAKLYLQRPAKSRREKRDLFHPLRKAVGFFCKLPQGVRCGWRRRFDGDRRASVASFATHTFSAAQTRALRSVAARHAGSSNDLLMRDLFLAVDDWNNCGETKDTSGMLRMMLPVTQRTPEEDELFPAANRVSMVKLDRDRSDLSDPEELLSGIIREIRQIRPLKRDLTFHRVARIIAAVPPLRWYMRRRAQRGYATTVLSQTGNVFSRAKLPRKRGIVQSGGLTLEAVDGAPPVNPFTPVSFATIWYAKRLTITMSFEPSCFTQQQADALLAAYVHRIQSSIAATPNAEVAAIAADAA